MMYSSLSRFDPITAAGILSRAALAVTDIGNPAASVKIHDEDRIRQEILEEIRKTLGVSNNDNTQKTLERIGDVLDAKSESLVTVNDSQSVLENLSNEGTIPSDLFDIVVAQTIEEFHGKKFHRERELIELTVKSPDQEQHYGEPVGLGEPFLISLFSKYIPNQFPLRSFTMLVAGQRKGLILVVYQVWRVYADLVDLRGVTSLVGMLERFSNSFGAEIEVGDKKGHFIESVEIKKGTPFPPSYKIPIRRAFSGKKLAKTTVNVTSFYQQSATDESNKAALIVAIDLDRYEDVLKMRGW